MGRRAFRRPLTAGETDCLMKLYDAGRGKLALGFGDTMGLLVEAMLQSPAFLYHWERYSVSRRSTKETWWPSARSK